MNIYIYIILSYQLCISILVFCVNLLISHMSGSYKVTFDINSLEIEIYYFLPLKNNLIRQPNFSKYFLVNQKERIIFYASLS